MSDDRDRQDALNQFWNALIRAERVVTGADLTLEEKSVVHWLQRAGTAPLTGLSADAAWPRVLARIEADRGTKEDPMFLANTAPISSPITLPNGRTSGHVPSSARIAPVRGLGRLAWGQVAAALVLLVTLGLGYLALRPGAPLSHRLAALPALMMPATPTPGRPGEETLLDLPIPADMIPRGDAPGSGFVHDTIDPGTTTTWDSPALRVEYVISGTYTVRSDGPMEVVAAGGGAPTTIPSGTDIALGPGDAMMAPQATTSTYTTSDTHQVQLLFWEVNDGEEAQTDPTPLGWMTHNVDLNHQPPLPPGAGRLHLQRIELAPDEALAPPPGTLQLAVTLPKNAAGTRTPNSIEHSATASGVAIHNFGREPTTVYVITLEPAATGTATP